MMNKKVFALAGLLVVAPAITQASSESIAYNTSQKGTTVKNKILWSIGALATLGVLGALREVIRGMTIGPIFGPPTESSLRSKDSSYFPCSGGKVQALMSFCPERNRLCQVGAQLSVYPKFTFITRWARSPSTIFYLFNENLYA